MEDLFGFLLLLAIPIALIWLFIRYRKVKRERDRLAVERIQLLKDKEELARENVLLETHHLKFQLQPHSLNNILSELRAIAKKLGRGMDSLSSTLEYILYKGRTNLVSVEEEVEFIRTYIGLQELFVHELESMRLDDKQVDAGSPHYRSLCIPHLITGYLIENAFKHGDKSHPQFLNITLKLDLKMFQMHVANKVRQTPNKGLGGLGLMNMEKRLNLLVPDRHRVDRREDGDTYHAVLTILLEQ